MALTGSYILGSSAIRVHDAKTKENKPYLVNDDVKGDPKTWTPNLLKEKTKAVFTQVPMLDCLIIIDPGIYSNDCINEAFGIAQKYTTKIKIIPALMARFCYVTSKTENPPQNLKEFLIIVTICQDLCDWHVLQLTSNGYDYITDYLHEKKDFDKSLSVMSQRYCNYKTILLYSKADEKFVSALKVRSEKLLVSNWNQMLTEGGIQKGIWMKNSVLAKTKDIIDFACGMALKLDNKQPFSLVKQGAKLPVKKKHSAFDDIRTFVITREYQHVDYDKITRESCVLFEKELSFEIYKFNIGVQIDKNGQCIIEFNSQKQIFTTPNDADKKPALPSFDNVPIPEKSAAAELIPIKGKAVIGYSLFSKTCKFYNPKTNKEETFKCNSSNELTFTDKSDLNDQSPTKRIEDLFSQLPIPTIDAIVYVHDGRFPIEWLKQARDVARRHTTRIYFISEPMSLKLNALRLMKTSVKENQTLALTFICGSMCLIYFLKRGLSTYSLVDEAEYSKVNLEKVRNVLLTRRSTDVAVIISDKLTPEIRETFVYKDKSILKVEFIEIENYGKAYVDGAMAKAQKVSDGSENYFDILQYCGHLKIKIDDYLGASLCPSYEQIPKTIKKVVNVKSAKELKIIQYKSAFNKREFVLHSNSEIPSSWEEIEITIKLYLAGLFDVIVSPISKPIVPSIPKPAVSIQSLPQPQKIISERPSLIYDPFLIPSKTFDGREKLQDQLYNIGCTFVIFLREEECNASMEVLLNGKFYQVKNPSGNIYTPAYVSFFNKNLKIGETALKDYRKKSEYVVHDMFCLLGRSTDQVNLKSTWRFSIAQHPQNPNSIVCEVQTWEGRRAVTPEFVLGLYFKALKRLAESVSKESQARVAIFIPPYYKATHNNALKEACRFAKLSLVQTMQYPRD